MAQLTYEILNADAMTLAVYCGGFANVGVNLAGTWVGTVFFEAATIDNPNVWIADQQTPFASGTKVSSATGNGSWFSSVQANIVAKRVRFSRTSGSVQVNYGVANDSSWQDAYLTSIQRSNSSSVGSGTNTLTQAAQTNRAWKLTKLSAAFASPGLPGGAGRLTIYDGTITGNVLWEDYLRQPTVAGSIGWDQTFDLPAEGITGTPGNALTIVLRGVNGSSILNGQFTAA